MGELFKGNGVVRKLDCNDRAVVGDMLEKIIIVGVVVQRDMSGRPHGIGALMTIPLADGENEVSAKDRRTTPERSDVLFVLGMEYTNAKESTFQFSHYEPSFYCK
jgi:hypothetical protein